MTPWHEAALAYHARGLHPIPCRPKTKVPMVPWREFQSTSPTLEQVNLWWSKVPNANVALVLGRGMFAVDFDGGDAAVALLTEAGVTLPPGPRSRTASGYHVFLSASGPVSDRVGLLSTDGGKPQVDIRGVGIVVAPPSIHPAGPTYEWEIPFSDDPPPRAPNALLKMIATKDAPVVVAPPETSHGATEEGWIAATLAGVSEGGRDQACTRLAGYLLHKGLDARTVEAVLVHGFAKNCHPVFPSSDVRKCVQSIARRENVAGEELTIAPIMLGYVLDQLSDDIANGRVAQTIDTPFPTLNYFLNGGFGKGELVYLGARPGVGKTAFGLECARRAAARDVTVLVVSREMTNQALARRFVSQDARVTASGLKRGALSNVEARSVAASITRLHDLPIWLTDEAVSFDQIQQLVAQFLSHADPALLVVDYLQLVRAPRDIKERRLQVEEVSQGLKTIALQYKIPVLCLSSLSRSSDRTSRKPTLESLRESGELEHDADIILFLHREYQAEETECIVAKNRDGRVGTIQLLFRSEFVAFDEVASFGAPS